MKILALTLASLLFGAAHAAPARTPRAICAAKQKLAKKKHRKFDMDDCLSTEESNQAEDHGPNEDTGHDAAQSAN